MSLWRKKKKNKEDDNDKMEKMEDFKSIVLTTSSFKFIYCYIDDEY